MEARAALKELAEHYFSNATVVYAKQSFRVKHEKPLVTLSFGQTDRPLNPPEVIVDGRPAKIYPTTMQVQIDLFTAGKKRDIAKGVTPVMENTAEGDLLGFVSFLNSAYAVAYCHNHDIAVVVSNTVQDLTDLINDTNYEYRAMVELELRFTTVALGYTGTLDESSVEHKDGSKGGDVQTDVEKLMPKVSVTASGGGNKKDEAEEDGYFTSVVITNQS